MGVLDKDHINSSLLSKKYETDHVLPQEMFKKNKKEGKYDLLVLETCLVKNNQNAWIIDSRATNHVFSSL